jgi:hypothetical protein
LEGAQTPIPEPHVGCTLSEVQNREHLGVEKNTGKFDPRDIGDSREKLSDIAIKNTCSEGTETPADSAIGCDAVKRNVLSKEARAQHRDAEVRQVAKEVEHSATSGNAIPVESGKISAVTSPKRKPPGEKEVGLRKKKLGSKVTRRNVVTRDVTRREVGLRGLKAGVKREQLGTSCSRSSNDRITVGNSKAKTRFPTSEKSGTEPQKKKKRRQKGISPGDKEIIPGTKEPRTLVVGEDHKKAVTDMATGKARSQNRCRKKKLVRKPLVNEMRNRRTRDREKSRNKENYRNTPIGEGSSDSEIEDDTDKDLDLEWVREHRGNQTIHPRHDETSEDEYKQDDNEISNSREGTRDRYNLRPRRHINYRE